MDVVQAWGPYASILLYLWTTVAYGTAYVRTRARYGKGKSAPPLFIALWGGMQMLFLASGPEENPPWIWWVNYVLFLFLPLVIVWGFHRASPPHRVHGYPRPIDVLLFRAPAPDDDSPPASALRPSSAQSWALLWGVALGLGAISFVGHGLQVCGWLDIPLGRSGCLRSLALDRETIEDLAFSPDGALLAAGGSGKLVHLYRTNTGELLQTLQGHNDWVTSVAFSPDGSLLASASWNGIVRLWRTTDYTLVREQRIALDDGAKTIRLAFSPDGTMFTTARYRLPVQLWRTVDGALLCEFPATGDAVAFSPDGRVLAIVQPGETIALLEWESGQLQRSLQGHQYTVSDLIFAADGQTLTSSSGDDRTIRRWQLADGALLQTLPAIHRSSIALAPGGQLLAAGGMTDVRSELRGAIELIDVATGSTIRSWQAHGSLVNAIAFSPDGTTLASGSSWETLRLWRTK